MTEHGELISGRYRLVEPVGQGGMGRVWRGFDETLGREIAVKEILFPPGLEDQQRKSVLQRMMREAQTAARLNHPGIVTVHDVVEHRGAPAIVMEFVRGQSLATLVREQGRLSPQRVAEIGSTVLDALSVAHAAGVVHRDLKPDNILLTRGRVVLTDFGIASTADATTALTSAGTVLGTPVYMAPEQLEGKPATAASDLWSLGATLYTAVEGQPPFAGPTLTSLAVAILTTEPRRAEHAGPLASVLGELLVKDPGQRATAEHTARAISAYLGTQRTEPAAPQHPADPHPATQRAFPPRPRTAPADPELAVQETITNVAPGDVRHSLHPTPPAEPRDTEAPPSRTASRLPRRRTLLVGLGGLGLLAAGAVPVTIALDNGRKGTSGEKKGTGQEGDSGSSVTLTGHKGAVEAVAFSPDGKTLASGGSEDDSVRFWDVTTRKNTATRTGSSGMNVVAFSPDGKTLAGGYWGDPFKEDQGGVRLWNIATSAATGEVTASLTGHRGLVTCVAFSPDGKAVASGAEDGTVRLWDIAAGRSGRPLGAGPGQVRTVAFSPDGMTLASGGGEDKQGSGTQVRLWDTTTNKARTSFQLDAETCYSLAFSPNGRTLAGGFGDTTELWDLGTGRHITTLTGSSGALAFSPDGRQLAIAAESDIGLWNVAQGKRIARFTGHTGYISSVAFSPDGRTLASSSWDKTIRLWKVS